MNGKQHFRYFLFLFFIVLVPLFIYLNRVSYLPLAFMGFVIVDPDEDLKYGQLIHRHFFYHSILFLGAIVAIFIPFGLENLWDIAVVLSFALNLHLILDIPSKNRSGTYCIKFIKSRLSGKWSVAWLLANVLLLTGIEGYWIYESLITST